MSELKDFTSDKLHEKGYSRREAVLIHKGEEVKRPDGVKKRPGFNGHGRFGKLR